MQQEQTTFTGWAIVELMGRSVIAGHVSEQTIGGAAFVRVDVPDLPDKPGYTKFYSASAIYAITPTDEPTAKRATERLAPVPVAPWIVSPPATHRMLETEGRTDADDEAYHYYGDEVEDGDRPF